MFLVYNKMYSKETVWFDYFLWKRQFQHSHDNRLRLNAQWIFFVAHFKILLLQTCDSYPTVMWFQETVSFMLTFAAVREIHFFMVIIIASFRDYARTVDRINWKMYVYTEIQSSDSIQVCVCINKHAWKCATYWVSRCTEWIHILCLMSFISQCLLQFLVLAK